MDAAKGTRNEQLDVETTFVKLVLHWRFDTLDIQKICYLKSFLDEEQYFRSQFDVFLVVQVGPSREKNQSSFHSLLH